MFKDWEECRLLCFHLSERMEDSIAKELIKKVEWSNALNEQDRPLFIFRHLMIACTESGIWDYNGPFKMWIKKEIQEMNNMMEYYEANPNGRTV